MGDCQDEGALLQSAIVSYQPLGDLVLHGLDAHLSPDGTNSARLSTKLDPQTASRLDFRSIPPSTDG